MKTVLTRAKQLIDARMSDPETAARREQSIALDLVGHIAIARDGHVRLTAYPQHGYLSSMGATEVLAKELFRAVAWFASNIGAKAPKAGKYSPLFATPTLFKEVWSARQVADELSIPYWFYAEYAVFYWAQLGSKRIPRPSQLVAPEIAAHVMACWADPGYRGAYPLFAGWDARFEPPQYAGDPVQKRALALIDQRLDDARKLGYDPAAALGSLLGRAISPEEATRRYGAELVDLALQAQEASDAEMATLVAQVLPSSGDSTSVGVAR